MFCKMDETNNLAFSFIIRLQSHIVIYRQNQKFFPFSFFRSPFNVAEKQEAAGKIITGEPE